MDTSLVQLSAVSLAMVPIVLALTSLSKNYIDSKWSPLVSIVLGILGALIVPTETIPLTLLQGVMVGLSASGLYSGVRSIASSSTQTP